MYLDTEVRRNISNFALSRDEDVRAGLDPRREPRRGGCYRL